MADDANEDSWLYGTSNPDSTTNDEGRIVVNEVTDQIVEMSTKSENEALAAIIGSDIVTDDAILDKSTEIAEEEAEMGEFEDLGHEIDEGEGAIEGDNTVDTTDIVKKEDKQEVASDADVDDEDDDSEDDINVVIGEMKTPSTYNIKQRSNLLMGVAGQDKVKPSQGGKFSIEDFEGVGSINGVAAHEFSIDSLEEKPWRKPGADITDYFNYGFNEETWRAYCERQKRFRVVESGVGLASLTQNLNPPPDKQQPIETTVQTGLLHPGVVTQGTTPGSINDHMQVPPPGLMPPPTHQGPPLRFCVMPRPVRPITTTTSSKENAIQVMTAECREYSRTGQVMPNFGGMGPADESYFHEPEPFDYGYEPTQEQNWGNENSNWMPTGIKELTPGPSMGPPPQMAAPLPPLRPPHPPAAMPPNMNNIPPNIVPNMNMGPPPPLGLMMGANGTGGAPAPMRMPMAPPRLNTPNAPSERVDEDRERRRREREWERERERERERDNGRSRRERSRSREKSRRRSKSREKEREKDREKDRDRDRERDRGRETDRERERNEKPDDNERSEEDRDRRRRERERERERDRDRERSRRERSRSREKSRRRSKSREKERERASKTTSSSSTTSSRNDKKKSHRKDDEE